MAGELLHLNENITSQWPEPNLLNSDNRPWFAAYAVTLTILVSGVVLARLWLQAYRSTTELTAFDALAGVGWVCTPPLTYGDYY